MIFSRQEIERRWTAVRQRLGDCECLVAPSFHNSYYLSGLPVLQWGRAAVTVLFRDHAPVFIIPAFETGAAARRSPIADVRSYRDSDGPSLAAAARLVAEALRERRVRTVGVEAGGMTAAMYLDLRTALPQAAFVDRTDAVDDVRLVSSAEEIRYLRAAAEIACTGLRAALDEIRPGAPERHVANRARLAMDEAASDDIVGSGTCYMQQGAKSIECHAAASAEPIRYGGFVMLVLEYEAWHYQGAVERCVLVGRAPETVERAYAVMAEAFQVCVDKVRPGVTFAEVDAAGRSVFLKAGYDDITTGSGVVRNIIHHTGGRIDGGNLRSYNHRPLEPGMVLTIEPWARIEGIGGAHHANMILVTETGMETLTPVEAGVVRVAVGRPAPARPPAPRERSPAPPSPASLQG
jgi:Xaa-Pro aminopeptidase